MSRPFTSETGKAARAITLARQLAHPFDRKAWQKRYANPYMREMRARLKAGGVCIKCGRAAVTRFVTCLSCRAKDAEYRRRRKMAREGVA
jgi:hypothetical protein